MSYDLIFNVGELSILVGIASFIVVSHTSLTRRVDELYNMSAKMGERVDNLYTYLINKLRGNK
jgi:hypothetical protein